MASYTISLISKMMHGGKVKSTDLEGQGHRFRPFPSRNASNMCHWPSHHTSFWRLAIWSIDLHFDWLSRSHFVDANHKLTCGLLSHFFSFFLFHRMVRPHCYARQHAVTSTSWEYWWRRGHSWTRRKNTAWRRCITPSGGTTTPSRNTCVKPVLMLTYKTRFVWSLLDNALLHG